MRTPKTSEEFGFNRYDKQRLERALRKASSQSEWVRKEILYAIKHKAFNDEAPPEIIPVLIEGPPPAKPPAELSFLHFDDKMLYLIKKTENLSM